MLLYTWSRFKNVVFRGLKVFFYHDYTRAIAESGNPNICLVSSLSSEWRIPKTLHVS